LFILEPVFAAFSNALLMVLHRIDISGLASTISLYSSPKPLPPNIASEPSFCASHRYLVIMTQILDARVKNGLNLYGLKADVQDTDIQRFNACT